MSIIVAILIEIATVLCAFVIMFAGSMRTTGGTSEDSNSALWVFVGGTIIALLVGASHWIGW